MFLRRVTITGFKTFATKTVLDLDTGITAIVGPNGSGKSNLADAIRWGLGEQNKSRLRLNDREEVIFAGTTTRPKASLAEVTLLFDNADGTFPLDLTEVEISRRQYRSGETEYRLAGRAVRLADLTALLAEAHCGAGSYAVIGQGMVDSLLLSSPAERKLLFDEAAGIRGPELGRESVLRKLQRTDANLTRLRDIVAELEPRLSVLERKHRAANQVERLSADIQQFRHAIIHASLQYYTSTLDRLTADIATTREHADQLTAEHRSLQHALDRLTTTASSERQQRVEIQGTLQRLERDRDTAQERLTTIATQLAQGRAAADQLAALKKQISLAEADRDTSQERLTELEADLATNAAAATRAATSVERADRAVAAAQAALIELRETTTEQARDQYVDHALQILKVLATSLSDPATPIDQIRLLVHKAGRLLSHATRTGSDDLLNDLEATQKRLESAMTKRDTAIEHQTNVTITRRSIEIDLAHQKSTHQRATTHLTALQDQYHAVSQLADPVSELTDESRYLTAQLHQLADQLTSQRQRLERLQQAADQSSGEATDHALRLERTATRLAAAKAKLASLESSHADATTALTETKTQGEQWGIGETATPAGAHTTTAAALDLDQIAGLRDQLARAEASLTAETHLLADTATEYESTHARHADLTAQIADLETARADLQRIVGELETVIRTRFRENFAALSQAFSHYFAKAFDGGSASLELTESASGPDVRTDAISPSDPLPSSFGITIKVTPKGKRPTALSALSGGERALTGIALVAAILQVNPSPFIVLDEVDAALDEANSSRLSGILSELGSRSQLIIITHNRQTMHAASVLFGVTTSEHHVSRLLSLRLAEATALAAR